MSLFKKLFGGSEAPKGPEPVSYNGYTIFPEPMKEPDGYRIAVPPTVRPKPVTYHQLHHAVH